MTRTIICNNLSLTFITKQTDVIPRLLNNKLERANHHKNHFKLRTISYLRYTISLHRLNEMFTAKTRDIGINVLQPSHDNALF